MKTTLLIDADIVAYRTASAIETPIQWDDELWTLHSDLSEGIKVVDESIQRLKDALETDDVVICLTDKVNFRTEIYPAYKQNRKDKRKPLILGELKQYMADKYPSFTRPGLEADDIMGILQTSTRIVEGETIVCTVDKDLRSVPGKFSNMSDPKNVEDITLGEADYNHLYQTLIGDTSDGYPGCKGIGPKKAEAILNPHMVSGKFNVKAAWADTLKAFEKAGFGEEEALAQARVARILRNTDYNFKTKEVIPWNI